MPAELATVLDESQARRLTGRIQILVRSVQETVDKLGEMISAAYVGRAWAAMGYESWDAYVSSEFGTDRLKLDRDERKEIVVQLRSAGMSTRAIGSAVGASEGTVRNDLSGAQDYAPDPVTGLDGKSYAPKPASDSECIPPTSAAETDDSEIFDAELVEDNEEPAPEPKPRAPRTDVVAVMNKVLTKSADAAYAAAQIKREHLKSRSEEAARWSRDLNEAIQSLQRLADLLKETS